MFSMGSYDRVRVRVGVRFGRRGCIILGCWCKYVMKKSVSPATTISVVVLLVPVGNSFIPNGEFQFESRNTMKI
jgi:hypothetical protein